MSNETDIPVENTLEALREIESIGLINYDFDQNIVWVVNAVKYQKLSPNEVKGIRNNLNSINHDLVSTFEGYYKELLSTYEGTVKELASKPKVPSGKGKGSDNDNDNDKNYSLEIEKFRIRYSPEQIEKIDRYFEILRTTRRSGNISESVIYGIYEDMHKYDPLIVQYACLTIIKKPELHDKKENYFAGILRNTSVVEAVKGMERTQKDSPKASSYEERKQLNGGIEPGITFIR
jgi:hypothetical protein